MCMPEEGTAVRSEQVPGLCRSVIVTLKARLESVAVQICAWAGKAGRAKRTSASCSQSQLLRRCRGRVNRCPGVVEIARPDEFGQRAVEHRPPVDRVAPCSLAAQTRAGLGEQRGQVSQARLAGRSEPVAQPRGERRAQPAGRDRYCDRTVAVDRREDERAVRRVVGAVRPRCPPRRRPRTQRRRRREAQWRTPRAGTPPLPRPDTDAARWRTASGPMSPSLR